MTIESRNIFKLLENNTRIKIPFFQRQYIWTFKDQIVTLIEDINTLNKNYYLGNIIFKKDNDNHLIIDGQQRITTFLIILSVINNEFDFEGIDLTNIKEHLKNFEFDSFYAQNKETLSKIIKSRINEIHEIDEKTQYYKNYLEIKKYFETYFSTAEKINQLIKKLDNVLFAEVCIDEDTNENILFSQINSTGVKLNQYDLFKNHILTKLIDVETDTTNIEEKIKKWTTNLDKINNSLTEENDYKTSDKLLRSFIAINTYYLCSFSKIFKVYTKYENTCFSDVKDTFERYCEFGFYYKYILNREYVKTLGIHFYQIAHEEFNTYSTLLVHSLMQFSTLQNQKVVINDKTQLEESIRIIEYYIISRKFNPEAEANVITRKIPLIIKDLLHFQKLFPDLTYNECLYLILIWIPIKRNIKYGSALKYATSDIEELRHFFVSTKIYEINNTFTKNFLIKLAKLKDKKMNFVFDDEWTVEHIMPQNLAKWIENGYDDSDLSKMHTIGNLTITKYNLELRNEIFTVKKNELFNKEGFVLNNYLLSIDDWNNEEIIKRSENLYNLFTEHYNLKNKYSSIFRKYNENDFLDVKLTTVENEKLTNTEKNLSYFRTMGINKQIIIDIIKKYYILGSGTKVEEAISGKNYSGWVFNSLRKVIPIDVKKYPDVNAFIEEFNYEIDQYLVNIEKMIDEKDY